MSALEYTRKIDWSSVPTWLLGFGLVVYLGLKGGGYDPLVHDRVGIAVWWVLLATALVGALPRRRLGTLAWCCLGLLTAFVAWTALSLNWTESTEKTAADLARVSTYLGVFALAVFTRGSRGARNMVAALGTGIVVVSLVALLSRFVPAWFPEASQTASFLTSTQGRLSFPLNYWNGLAALIAIGIPLMLHVGTCAAKTLPRVLAIAALPAMALASFLTLSRGGIAAAIIALIVFLTLTTDRLPKLLSLLVAGCGSAILIAGALQRDALLNGLPTTTANHQGSEMLAMLIVVCAGVGLIQAGICFVQNQGAPPRWTVVSRTQALALALGTLFALLITAVALNAPSRASEVWSDFKQIDNPGTGTKHLASVAGEGRYQLWQSAVNQERTKPMTGTGSGTFEFWWARNGNIPSVVRDTHSLYMQTFGELGLVGLILLTAFLLAILLGGVWSALRASRNSRPQLAAAIAGCVAFCVTATFDWVWQIPVLPVSLLLLASVLATSGSNFRRSTKQAPGPGLRSALVLTAVGAIAAIAIPLSSSILIRQSQTYVNAGNLDAALRAAQSAENVQPGAASPHLQQALLLELGGNLPLSASAARAATRREPTNWQTWIVLSRIEAKQGRTSSALRHYRTARSLNPQSILFDDH